MLDTCTYLVRFSQVCLTLCWGLTLTGFAQEKSVAEDRFQYQSDQIAIPAASADEPKVQAFDGDSVRAAAKYLDEGALAWTRERSCMACHTTGVYLAERSALTAFLGAPLEEVRTPFVVAVSSNPVVRPSAKPHGFSVWYALGLAQWDRHVADGGISDATDLALRQMLMELPESGLYTTVSKVEIPYTTTGFELTVQAARALASSPSWVSELKDAELQQKIARLKRAIAAHQPRNDYERALQLQLATAMPDLVPQEVRAAAIAMIREKQHPDGGWSTRDMSAIENWGDKIRPDNIAMLRAEADSEHPESDAYMTAFAVILMRENGVSAVDPAIQRAIVWLKSEQRVSGRWWMKSLYKPTKHFSTYIATVHALRALALCDEIPRYGTEKETD